MVKQHLWIVNSTLVGLLILSVGTHVLIKQDVPTLRIRKRRSATQHDTRPTVVVNLEKIYNNDLFGTYQQKAPAGAQAKNLVKPIPKFKSPPSSAPPSPPPAQFLSPLNITLKGVIVSDVRSDSIAMVADQTGKEQVYRIGDKIQDAQVIQLSQNKLVVLRNNGQQETFYLRKPDKLTPGLSSWDYAIKKIDDSLYHLDPIEITKELSSVGEVIEALDLGGAYQGDTSLGVQVGQTSHHPLGEKLGLQKEDIITQVNDIPALTSKDRIRIFDTIAALPMGGHIHVTIKRSGQEKTISYLLKRLEKPSPFSNPATRDVPKKVEEENELFRLSKNAQRQQKRHRFEHVHRTQEQREQANADMRKRLLNDMKERAQHRRVL